MTLEKTQDPRQLGDSFAVAFLQWPAVIGVLELGDGGWAFALKIVLGTWALLVSLGLIIGRKQGPRWGLTMTLCAGFAAALWLTYPGLWTFVWFMALMVTFYAAIRARMEETVTPRLDEPPKEP